MIWLIKISKTTHLYLRKSITRKRESELQIWSRVRPSLIPYCDPNESSDGVWGCGWAYPRVVSQDDIYLCSRHDGLRRLISRLPKANRERGWYDNNENSRTQHDLAVQLLLTYQGGEYSNSVP